MRIACLQFAPQVGDVDNNLNRADAVLSKANPKDLDLLVLPELAFSGYNFQSLEHIEPYLEPTTSGITSLWARTTALKHNCVVTVGYPEKVTSSPKWTTVSPRYYNSAITVNADGETIANYRKSFLYHTDETWALQGPDGFYGGAIDGLGEVAMGICMDLNPYKFEAPWNAWEFAYHILHRQANLVILSMAWLTREDAGSFSQHPKEPDMETLSYWLSRLEPIIRAEAVGEIIVVLANRTGTEGDATYAGTSAILGIQRGEVKVYGILGRGEKELLVVDTNRRPHTKLVSEPNSSVSHSSGPSSTATSTSTTATKDSQSSTDSELPTPMPKSSPTEKESPVVVFPETNRTLGLGLGLGESVDTAGDQISVLSPVPSSPDTPFAPTDLRTNDELLAESLMSRGFGRKRSPSEFSDEAPRRPESPKSRNVSRSPRATRPTSSRPVSRSPRQRRDVFMSPCVSEMSFQYPELPASRDTSRSPGAVGSSPNLRSDSRSPRSRRVASPCQSEMDFQYPELPPSRNASRSPRELESTPNRSLSMRRSPSTTPNDRRPNFEEISSSHSKDPGHSAREPRSLHRRSSSKIREPRSSHSRASSKLRDPSATPSISQSEFEPLGRTMSRHASRPPKAVMAPRQTVQPSPPTTQGDDEILSPLTFKPPMRQFPSLSPRKPSKPLDPKPRDSPVVLQNLAAKLIFGSYGLEDSPLARIISGSKETVVVQPSPTTRIHRREAAVKKFETSPLVQPRSASALQENYLTQITTASFGPRSEHTLQRSRSSMW